MRTRESGYESPFDINPHSPVEPDESEGVDLVIAIELRRNDTGKTVGVFQERMSNREHLTLLGIKTYWDLYGEKIQQIFPYQIIPELPYAKLDYFAYWTRYNPRDNEGFYFKCPSWHERRTIPDPFMNPHLKAYALNLVFYLVEDLADPIPHEGHDPLDWVQ